MAYPTTFTNAQDTITEIVAAHINALEVKVGIDSSADPTSLDYKITQRTIGGSDTQVQFNDGGLFAGDSGFIFDKTTGILAVKRIDMYPTPLNVFIGGGNGTVSGSGNIAISASQDPYRVLGALTSGSNNIGIGKYTMMAISSGSNNIAIGYVSQGYSGATSDGNVSIGVNTLPANSGSYNTVVGTDAMGGTNTGSFNSAFGYQSLMSSTSGTGNVAIGHAVLNYNTTGSQNTAIGKYSLSYNYTGSNNVAIGYGAGIHESGDNHLWIDNTTRSDLADAQVKALIYGTFDALTANQLVRVNAKLEVLESATFQNLTASLPVFTDSNKKLVSKSLADTRSALGVNNPPNMITNSGFGVWSNSTLENVGSELIVYGDGTATTGWSTTGGSLSVGSGYFTATNGTGTTVFASKSFTTVIGKLYKCIYSLKKGSATAAIGGIAITSAGNYIQYNSCTGDWTVYTIVFEATTTTTYFLAQTNSVTTGETVLFDNVTCYEVTPGCVAADAKGPDGWEKYTSIDVWREHNGSNTKDGSFYACKLYKASGASAYDFYWPSLRSGISDFIKKFSGRTVTFGCWVKGSTAGKVEMYIRDAVSTNATAVNVGTSFEWMECTLAVSSSAATFHCGFRIDASGGAQTVYMSQPMLIFGSYIGEGNYQLNPGEFVDVETQIQVTLPNASALLNIEALTNGKIPKGILGADIVLYGANATVGEYIYMAAGSGGVTGGVMRTQVSSVTTQDMACYQKADVNGDFYASISASTWGAYLIFRGGVKVS